LALAAQSALCSNGVVRRLALGQRLGDLERELALVLVGGRR